MKLDDILRSMESVLEGDPRTLKNPVCDNPKEEILYNSIATWYKMLREYELENEVISK